MAFGKIYPKIVKRHFFIVKDLRACRREAPCSLIFFVFSSNGYCSNGFCNPLVDIGGFVIHIINRNGIANPGFSKHWITNPMEQTEQITGNGKEQDKL